MGIVQSQSIKGSIYTYIGVIVGFITTGLLMPHILTPEQIGLQSLIASYSITFATVGTLGFVSVITRNFAFFRNDKNGHNGFPLLMIKITTLGATLAVGLFYILKPVIISVSVEKSRLFTEYIDLVAPLIAASTFFIILDMYNSLLYNSVRGLFLKEFFTRILILMILLLYYYGIYGFRYYIYLYSFALATPGILILILLILDKSLNLKPYKGFITKTLRRQMTDVAIMGLIAAMTSVLSSTIDKIMLSNFNDLNDVGIYSVSFLFATLIIIPSRSLIKISTPVLSEAWKRNDIREIKKVYYKSALNQFLISIFILVGIWANIHNIYKILPSDYEQGKYIILIIGFAGVTDMLAGVSASIIQTSEKYRYYTYIMILYLITLLVTNYFFIKNFGILGAAFAALFSKIFFNSSKYFFLLYKYKLQIYNYKFLLIFVIGIVVYIVNRLLIVFDDYIVDIITRTLFITVFYWVLSYVLHVSEDVNNLVDNLLITIRNKLKK